MIKKVVLWGLGNPILGDDAAGSALIEKIRPLSPEWLEPVACDTVPENFLSPLRQLHPDLLIIVDAADMGLPGGEYRKMELQDFSNISFTTHGMPLDLILQDFLPHMRIIAIGIQPVSREPSLQISEKVLKGLLEIAEMILSGKCEEIQPLLP